MIPITREVNFVMSGTYTGRTALSIEFWTLATILLACTTIYSFIHLSDRRRKYLNGVLFSLGCSCALFLASCMAQYGILLSGPAGISIPLGIVLVIFWLIVVYKYPSLLDMKSKNSPTEE